MFKALYRTIVMLWRMIKSACLRPFRSIYARFRRATNLTRQASSVVPKLVKSATSIKAKPSKREDYIDAGHVYIAKSLIFIIIAAIIAIWLLGQFVIWPWMQGKWFTAKLYEQEQKVEGYTGRVKLYYDEDKMQIAFHGKLEDGVKTGKGTEYYENGIESFIGSYDEAGLYTGNGKMQDENGNTLYTGEFAQGLYEGEGKLYQNAQLIYEGDFVQGERTGKGKAYENGALVYDGEFAEGIYQGAGKTYHANGQVAAECLTFMEGQPDGMAIFYNENGTKAYEGSVTMGVKQGEGTLYDAEGKKVYSGTFAANVYEGAGTEYYAGGEKKYEGSFVGGAYSGEGKLMRKDGAVLYEGDFANGQYEGDGTLLLDNGMTVTGQFSGGALVGAGLYSKGGQPVYMGVMDNGNAQGEGVLYVNGAPAYTGGFVDGFIDGGALMDLPVEDLRGTVFAGAELEESQAERGFIIKNNELNAAVFCNYGYNAAQIVVHRVYLYDTALLSNFAGDAFVLPEGCIRVETEREIPLNIPGVKAAEQTAKTRVRYVYEDYVIRLWQDAAGNVDMIEWRSWTDLATEEASEDGEGAMVDNLLTALGFGTPAQDAASEDADGGAAG